MNAIQGTIFAYLSVVLIGGAFVAFVRYRVFFYLLPLLPFFTRGIVATVFYPVLSADLEPEEQQRGDYRTLVIGLMPISFAGLIALTIFDAKVASSNLGFAGYYMLLSFLAFFLVLNIQSYKDREWIGQLGNAVLDAATLSMLLSIVAILFSGQQPVFFKSIFVTTALGVWSIDHAVRLHKETLVLMGKLK